MRDRYSQAGMCKRTKKIPNVLTCVFHVIFVEEQVDLLDITYQREAMRAMMLKHSFISGNKFWTYGRIFCLFVCFFSCAGMKCSNFYFARVRSQSKEDSQFLGCYFDETTVKFEFVRNKRKLEVHTA